MAASFSGRLTNRTVVRVTAQDPHGFLQGMFCNDLRSLTPGGSLYGCFLNKSGRVIADAILMQSKHEQDGGMRTVFMDVDRTMASDVVKHLLEFKLRRKVKVEDLTGKTDLIATRLAAPQDAEQRQQDAEESFPDPRAPYLRDDLTVDNVASPIPLRRVVVPALASAERQMVSAPAEYDHLLIQNGIYEGPSVFSKEKSLPFESNLDMLNGVSFHKGCYLGQELTHRTHVMLVTRKRTVPLVLGDHLGHHAGHVALETSVSPSSWGGVGGNIFSEDGSKIGVIQAVAHNKAVGLLRLRYFDPVSKKMRVKLDNGAVATASIPHWWDDETVQKIFGNSSQE
jgi:transferase CAF17, mitochondrial